MDLCLVYSDIERYGVSHKSADSPNSVKAACNATGELSIMARWSRQASTIGNVHYRSPYFAESEWRFFVKALYIARVRTTSTGQESAVLLDKIKRYSIIEIEANKEQYYFVAIYNDICE